MMGDVRRTNRNPHYNLGHACHVVSMFAAGAPSPIHSSTGLRIKSCLPPDSGHLRTDAEARKTAYFHLRRLGYVMFARISARPIGGRNRSDRFTRTTLCVVEVKYPAPLADVKPAKPQGTGSSHDWNCLRWRGNTCPPPPRASGASLIIGLNNSHSSQPQIEGNYSNIPPFVKYFISSRCVCNCTWKDAQICLS